jgi:hypothetical protein
VVDIVQHHLAVKGHGKDKVSVAADSHASVSQHVNRKAVVRTQGDRTVTGRNIPGHNDHHDHTYRD